MSKKVLIPLYGHEVAPRFDMTSEAMIVSLAADGSWKEKLVVLPQVSAEKLCHMILTQDVDTVICGGIEEEYYQYLTWKRITVYDSVIGPWKGVIDRFLADGLQPGAIVSELPEAQGHAE